MAAAVEAEWCCKSSHAREASGLESGVPYRTPPHPSFTVERGHSRRPLCYIGLDVWCARSVVSRRLSVEMVLLW